MAPGTRRIDVRTELFAFHIAADAGFAGVGRSGSLS
jgi:hypothetical protein